MTTVSLSELLNLRDESLRAPSTRRSLSGQWRAIRIHLAAPAWLRPVLTMIATLIGRHGLVLSGCAAVVTSAAMITPALGWFTAGAAFFFLEARRR